jgi:lipopolysaccharide export system protein LptA
MSLRGFKKIVLLLGLLFPAILIFAQQPLTTDTTAKKQINILHADKISYKKTDSLNEYQLLVGNVAVKQEKTLFYCDSAALNTKANILEAYGKVHINDNDSLNIFSDYLKYLGKEKKAILTGNVRLTDGKGTLTTSHLDYDLNTHIGNYVDGGKVVNGKTVLTSKEGFYYEDTRDVYFKKNVLLVDPEYTIKTDTLLYNTYTGIATFVVPTTITSDSGRKVVKTKDGYYDTKNKKTYFSQRTEIQDHNTFIVADDMANDSLGFGEAKGNVIYRDTAQKVTILANHMQTNRNNGSFLATEKPIMILEQEKGDSLFIAADTMYSARLSDLRKYRIVPVIIESQQQQKNDTAIPATNKITETETEEPGNIDSTLTLKDSSNTTAKKITTGRKSIVIKDSATEQAITKTNANAVVDSATTKDSSIAVADSSGLYNALAKKDSALQSTMSSDTSAQNNDSTNRFFEAYYHVRIYSDSLQAVGDSMFYSGEDSAFRLFKQPIVWSRESQVTGDTIYLFTQNKKPSRLYVFENALSIDKVGPAYYNQVKGRTINGYFKNGNMDYIRAKGNAESIYYAQDEGNKFVGVNKATSDIIDMYFQEKKPEKVVFRSNLVGTTYPMRQVNHEELRLRGFKWLDDLRPKSKYDLFAD